MNDNGINNNTYKKFYTNLAVGDVLHGRSNNNNRETKHTAAETNEPVAVAARKTMEKDEDGDEQWRYSIQNIQWWQQTAQVESSRSNEVKRSTLQTNSVRSLNFGTLKQMGVSNHHWPAGRAHSYVT